MTWTVPALADCDAGIEPSEFYCLVAMAEKPEKSAGGIIFTQETQEREQWGTEHGRLLAVSPLAFTYADNWPPGAKPAVGDVVFTGRYPGKEVTGRDGKTYRLVSDREIAGIIERAQPPIPIMPPAIRVEEVERLVEGLFASVGPDIDGASTELGSVCVAFANGHVRVEGELTPHIQADVVDKTLKAICAAWPDHQQRCLRWRRRPELRLDADPWPPTLYLRLAADPINAELEDAA